MPPRPASTMGNDASKADISEPAAKSEPLPSVPAVEKRSIKMQRVNSKFPVNPSSTGLLHHGWQGRAEKRAQSCGPGHEIKQPEQRWVARRGKWVLEGPPPLSLEDQIQRYRAGFERETHRYEDKISRNGYM